MDVLTVPKHISTGVIENPFPGLRPFGLEESHLFFGREGQSEEVIYNLSQNKFVAVIGASGSGKSSLLYCGVIPVLYGGFVTNAGSKWRIITARPGNDPVRNLAKSISGTDDDITEHNILESVLRRSSFGIEEAIAQIKQDEDENFLLVIDQFEELFRFKSSRNQKALNDSEGYVKLIIQAVKQSKLPIYVVLTMRSDFIGDCSQFTGLTSLINQSNYLVPQMTRDDFKEAVEGPVAVGGAKIEPQLVQELLNEIGDNPDQLPILQHALMRTWDYWKKNSDKSKPVSLTDYEAVGKMQKALSNHANEAFDELNEEQKTLCESIFKALTQKGTDNRGVRRPTKVSTLASIANCSVNDVIDIVNVFRRQGRSFLTPSYEIELDGDAVVDISHESLMRIWERLKIWVDDEANSVQLYLRLSESAEMFQAGKAGLWRPPDLDLAVNWRQKNQPTVAWAERHNPAFERAMVFLDSSEEEFKNEEENKIRLQKRQLRRTRNFSIVLGVAFILSLIAVVIALDQKNNADKQMRTAEEQRQIAEEQKELAQEQQEIAENALVEAKEQKEIAEGAMVEAKEQKGIAETQMVIANKQRTLAEKNAAEAREQTEKARKNFEEAQRQSKIAAEKSEEAYKRRILAIAQSMGVKSQQIDNDYELQALVAYQAYQFNKNYGGLEHNNDIYNGLYSAWKSLNENSLFTLKAHDDAIQSLVFEPGTNALISAGADGKLIKWDINGKTFNLINQNDAINQILAISSDGKWLACGTDGQGIQLYDLKNNAQKVKDLFVHNNMIRVLRFSRNGKHLYSSGVDNTIKKWTVGTWKEETIIEHDTRINTLDVSNNENLIIAGTKLGEIVLWDRTNNYQARILQKKAGSPVWSVCFSNDNKLFVTGDVDGNINVWDVPAQKVNMTLRGHSARVQEIKFSPDDKTIGSVSMDGTLRLWDRENLNNQPIVLSDHEGFVFSIAFSNDNKFVVTGSTDEDRLIVRPVNASYFANNICIKIDRNMTREEWNTFVAEDVEYEETCKK